MTNYEKHKDKLRELIDKGTNLAVDEKTGELCNCKDISCLSCAIYDTESSCKNSMIKWLLSEYEEPPVDWSKVPVDTPILVKMREADMWRRRYFAGIIGDMVITYPEGRTSWSITSGDAVFSWPIAKLYKEEDKNE